MIFDILGYKRCWADLNKELRVAAYCCRLLLLIAAVMYKYFLDTVQKVYKNAFTTVVQRMWLALRRSAHSTKQP